MRPIVSHDTTFFHSIDSKDKSYWLGLLYADGCVKKNKIEFAFGIHDVWFLDKISRTFHKYKHRFRFGRLHSVDINGKLLTSDLISHGCVPHKSKIIELPKLDSRELYLSFLLGYFDGDGTQGKTKITSGSSIFLEQIKKSFRLNYNIIEKRSGGFIEGNRPISGKAYEMSLGANLFNEMMDNYVDSLPRKRKHFCTNKERVEKIKQTVNESTGRHKRKFDISDDDLKRIVWEMPSSKIAEKFGISDVAVAKRCKKLGIEKPGRGYWTSVRKSLSNVK